MDESRALAAAAERTAALVVSIGDMNLAVPGSTWTVGEVAAHLAVSLRGMTAVLGGLPVQLPEVPATGTFPERLAAFNAGLIAGEPSRTAESAGRAIVQAAGEFVATAGRLPADQTLHTPWYGDTDAHTVATMTAVLLGEQLVHGLDIAAAARRPWKIAGRDAALVFTAVQAQMPLMVKPSAAPGGPAIYELRVGRQSRFIVRLDRGRAAIEPVRGQRVDCHIAGDPAALLLIGYGRISYWNAIGHARMVTWGRKPWLAFRFPGSFFSP